MKIGEIWEYKAHGCLVKIVRIWLDEDDDDDEMVEVKSLGCDAEDNVNVFEGLSLDLDDDEFPYYFREEFLQEFRKVYEDKSDL